MTEQMDVSSLAFSCKVGGVNRSRRLYILSSPRGGRKPVGTTERRKRRC